MILTQFLDKTAVVTTMVSYQIDVHPIRPVRISCPVGLDVVPAFMSFFQLFC